MVGVGGTGVWVAVAGTAVRVAVGGTGVEVAVAAGYWIGVLVGVGGTTVPVGVLLGVTAGTVNWLVGVAVGYQIRHRRVGVGEGVRDGTEGGVTDRLALVLGRSMIKVPSSL